MYLHKTPFWLRVLYPSFTWRGPADKTIYLTFDDGPIPGVTDWVLDQLAHYQLKATFFCVGDNIRKHPGVFARILIDGHSVGNHTFHHLNGWQTGCQLYLENVQLCQATLPPGNTLFRPPYGKITRKQALELQNAGHQLIMWDVLTGDFDRSLPPEACLRKSIRATGNGSIVVFHDSLKAQPNLVHTLPKYIGHFLEKGFSFEKL